jgi:hypothetical protein
MKKLFPNYVSKAELKRQVQYWKGFTQGHTPNIIKVTRNIVQLYASIDLDYTASSIPTAELKLMLAKKLAANIVPLMEFDIRDANGPVGKEAVGRLFVEVK